MRTGLLLCLLLPLLALADDAARVRSTVREAGYTIGSIVHQRVDVETSRGYRLDPGSLPEKGQTDAIELRDAHWEAGDVGTVTRHSIMLDWQIFVAADNTRVFPLKRLQLQFVRDGKTLPVTVAADKVIISSLLPAKLDKHLVQPYPDVVPPTMPLRGAWLALAGGILGLAVALLYFAHYFGWLFQARAPRHFRSAARDIRRMRLGNANAEIAKLAMQRLARAYDAYAGYAVSLERLDMLLALKPDLLPLEEETKTFYRSLHLVFFAGKPPEYNAEALERLACHLGRAVAI